MEPLRILEISIYAFGVFAFAWIGANFARWSGRAPREAPPECRPAERTVAVLLGVCFVWFCVTLARAVAEVDPRIPPGWFRLGELVLSFAFPPLIMQVAWNERPGRPESLPHPIWRLALGLAWTVAIVLPVWSVLYVLRIAPGPDWFFALAGISVGGAFSLTAVFSSAVMLKTRPRRESTEQRAGRRSALFLYAAVVGLVLLVTAAHARGWEVVEGLTLVSRSLPLVFVFTAIYHENRFEFFDVLVKRGLALVLTFGLLVVAFAALLPWLDGLGIASGRAWLFALATLPVAMALPWVHRRLADGLDRLWLGRRYTPVEATQRFLTRLGGAETREAIVAAAESELAEVFRAPVRVRLGVDTAEEAASDLAIPIRSGPDTSGTILLGRRANHVPYFSEDLLLLGSLAEVLASTLGAAGLREDRLRQEQLARELTLAASRSELKALRAQIRPHFLFNALNAIAGLIHKDPLRADRTVERLAEVFRYTLRGSQSEWAVLDDELEFARSYLEVEQARFGRRLAFRVEAHDGAGALHVPTMVVQTLVENAVKHGIARVRGDGEVGVRARRDADRLVIEVTDSGPGFDDEPARTPRGHREGGYGLHNVRERLAGHFGGRAALDVRRDEARGRTVVSLTLPVGDAVGAGRGEGSTGGAV